MSTEIVFWLPSHGGKYGFARLTLPDETLQKAIQPLFEEEELKQLMKRYELDDHRLYPSTPQISFEEYLKVWRDQTQRSRTTIKRGK